MSNYQEKFNELDAEIKDQMLIDRKRKCVIDLCEYEYRTKISQF